MPSLAEQYSRPEDIEAYAASLSFFQAASPPPVPLREHGPEEDDRYCRKHYQPDGFLNRLLPRRRCAECEQEAHRQWLAEVQNRLQNGLRAASEGRKIVW